MKFDIYQDNAASTDQAYSRPGQRKFFIPLMVLIGEVGSLIAEYKKCLRDGSAHENYTQNLIEDLGDALWYVATLARRYELSFAKIAHHALIIRSPEPLPLLEPDEHRKNIEIDRQDDIDAFQAEAGKLQRLDIDEEKNLFVTLIEASKKTNELIDQCMRANDLQDQKTIMMVGLGSILWQLSYIASIKKVKLSEAAAQNLEKIASRWPGDTPQHTSLFDDPYPAHEQFPRYLEIVFKGYERPNSADFTIISCNGIQIGDRLTDNTYEDTGYRFHDAIHYAFMAILGWSPVMRRLFKVKRKSDPEKDEVDDGARAVIIEEAVVGLTYDCARDHGMFEGQTEIDHSRIKTIQKLCRGLEVEQCKPWEWRKAILKGYEMFRKLRDNKGGLLILDLHKRDIEYRAL